MTKARVSAERWRAVFREQQSSGLSVAAFCRRTRVPQASFYAWRRKGAGQANGLEIRRGGVNPSQGHAVLAGRKTTGFVEVKLSADRSGRADGTQILPSAEWPVMPEFLPRTRGIELLLPGRCCLVIRPGWNQTLRLGCGIGVPRWWRAAWPKGDRRMMHLPSLAELDRASSTRIWLCTGPTDMRRGFDRLAEQAQTVTRQDPQSGHLFAFRSRNRDRLKLLYFDKDGYVLWYKRLESGTFKLPKVEATQQSVELRASELAMILDGIDLAGVRRGKRYRREEKVL